MTSAFEELTERALEVGETSIMERIQLVLTKQDTVENGTLDDKKAMISGHGFSNPLLISSHTGEVLRVAIDCLEHVVRTETDAHHTQP